MTTRAIIEQYFERLKSGNGWQQLLSDGLVFTSYTSGGRELRGKQEFLEGTRRFYSSIRSVEVRQLTVEDDRAVALTHYQLLGPNGPFTSDVAEVFSIAKGKIASLGIYFDTAPFPK